MLIPEQRSTQKVTKVELHAGVAARMAVGGDERKEYERTLKAEHLRLMQDISSQIAQISKNFPTSAGDFDEYRHIQTKRSDSPKAETSQFA
jgi:hypothetical protein